MAITIRNKTTEELIRKIGRRTGEGPSAVVRRLAESEVAQPKNATASKPEYERRRAVFAELRRKYPPPDPKPTWTEIQEEVDALYTYLDEPQQTAKGGDRS